MPQGDLTLLAAGGRDLKVVGRPAGNTVGSAKAQPQVSFHGAGNKSLLWSRELCLLGAHSNLKPSRMSHRLIPQHSSRAAGAVRNSAGQVRAPCL